MTDPDLVNDGTGNEPWAPGASGFPCSLLPFLPSSAVLRGFGVTSCIFSHAQHPCLHFVCFVQRAVPPVPVWTWTPHWCLPRIIYQLQLAGGTSDQSQSQSLQPIYPRTIWMLAKVRAKGFLAPLLNPAAAPSTLFWPKPLYCLSRWHPGNNFHGQPNLAWVVADGRW